MSDEKPGSPSKLSKIFHGSFNTADREKFFSERQALPKNAEVSAVTGYISEAGQLGDGSFYVCFSFGAMSYSSSWQQWAYELARDALLHRRQLFVAFTGEGPFGDNIVAAYVQNTQA